MSLPPARTIDHSIILEYESIPVRVPPYRYAHFQKEEIERQVAECFKIRSYGPALVHSCLLSYW